MEKFRSEPIPEEEVHEILILHEERIFLIGDFCVRCDKLRYVRAFFRNAMIHVNFRKKEDDKIFNDLLKNNPNIDRISTLDWDEIDFERYDVIFCAAYNEKKFLDFLTQKYGTPAGQGRFRKAVYSMSKLLLAAAGNADYIFPQHEPLIKYVKVPRPGELYLSVEERKWGNEWLESKGVKENERVFILLDSSSRKSKLLNIDVYFDFLKFILSIPDAKVLIFDERKIGKEEFYREWLGDIAPGKMIFSKGLRLRENLCLVGSDHTKMVFGPCTGLMHCASGIYNNYVNIGMEVRRTPLLITYTGQYLPGESNANGWWGSSPLVNCLLMKEENNQKKLILLSDLTDEEKNSDRQLPCSDYSARVLIDFVCKKLKTDEGRKN